eukprot:2463434-Alexandrium_andersonii.AAC.1
MSASLVGSEMCIRDRCMQARFLMALSLVVTAFGRNRATEGSQDLVSPCSVSYTHLTLPTICSV